MSNQGPQEPAVPASVAMEKTVLGAALQEGGGVVAAVLDRLTPADFFLESHQRIFLALKRLHERHQGVDLVTVFQELTDTKEIEKVGGPAYLSSLTEGVPRHPQINQYIRVVREKAKQRLTLSIGRRLAQEAEDNEDTHLTLQRGVDDLKSLLFDDDETSLQSVGDYLTSLGNQPDALFEHLASTNGIPVGFDNLDAATGGFAPGDLVIVAARPSMGKTAWAVNAASACAVRHGYQTAFFSLEMKNRYIIRRMLSASTRIDYQRIKRNELRSEDRALLNERREMLASAPLYLCDKPKLTVSRIRTMCERQKATTGLDIIFIDQLSKIHDGDIRERNMPKHERVGAQTTALKQLAQELDVPLVLFNQLSRESTKRADPRPALTDLKESGSIEEDADVVILLHRPEYYDKTDASLKGVGEQIIAKLREGETKTIKCSYQGHILRWEDIAEQTAQQTSFAPVDDYYQPPDSYWQAY